MTKREQLVNWLADAHAMEVGIVSTLEKQIAEAKGMPKVKAALTSHLRETKRHASEMKKALSSMGGTHPYIKEGASKLVNLAAGLVPTLAKDTVVKNAIAAYATEHFEIACYTSLIATATELGERDIAAACRQILKEEKAMAALLAKELPTINAVYLSSLEPDPTAPVEPVPANEEKTKAPATRKVVKKKRATAAAK